MKSAAELHRLLVETYAGVALMKRSCRKCFHISFKTIMVTSKTKKVAKDRKCIKTFNLKHYIRSDSTRNLTLLRLSIEQNCLNTTSYHVKIRGEPQNMMRCS